MKKKEPEKEPPHLGQFGSRFIRTSFVPEFFQGTIQYDFRLRCMIQACSRGIIVSKEQL